MKSISLTIGVLLLFSGLSLAQDDQDHATFVLTPTPPPTPALKYELIADPRYQKPGNAALLYSQAIELFDGNLDKPDVNDIYKDGPAASLTLLELAGEREDCDWGSPMGEEGANTLLPHLNSIRGMYNVLEARAQYQMRQGNIDEALRDLRMGLELGRNIGKEPVLVSGLVSVGIEEHLRVPLTELMNRPDSPNLYWALASLPRPLTPYQHSVSYELTHEANTFHELLPDRVDDLSAAQWHGVFDRAVAMIQKWKANIPASEMGWADQQTVADEVKSDLPQASQDFASAHQMTADQVSQLDPFQVVAWYWYDQAMAFSEDQYKLSALPFPLLIPRAAELEQRQHELRAQQPANVFLAMGVAAKAPAIFARAERTISALTDVEAIRSFAAANNGTLPASLDQIIDTPSLDNPRTGMPFDYQVNGTTATLSDPGPTDDPLVYTISIRK